jgi:hypothetical protein
MEPTSERILKAALYDDLRYEIRRIAHRMEKQFRKHDADRGDPFQEQTFEFLSERFDEKWDEFMTDIGSNFRLDCNDMYPTDGRTPAEVFLKGSDCCNFILMICEKYEKDYTKFHGKEKK